MRKLSLTEVAYVTGGHDATCVPGGTPGGQQQSGGSSSSTDTTSKEPSALRQAWDAFVDGIVEGLTKE
jgi:hypothetical protein